MSIGADPESRERLATFARWLSDGSTWIGVFENHDLGSRTFGHRIAVPYDDDQWNLADIGKSHAPDHEKIGLGWRFLLVAKLRDAEEAERWIVREAP